MGLSFSCFQKSQCALSIWSYSWCSLLVKFSISFWLGCKGLLDFFIVSSINAFLSPVKYIYAEEGPHLRLNILFLNLKQLYIVSTFITGADLPYFVSFFRTCPFLEELYIDVSSLVSIFLLSQLLFLDWFRIPSCSSSIHQMAVEAWKPLIDLHV